MGTIDVKKKILADLKFLKANPSKVIKVESSNIEKVAYLPDLPQEDPEVRLGNLFVFFKGDKLYIYRSVPSGMYENLLKAESKGKFLNAYIIPKFDAYKIVK